MSAEVKDLPEMPIVTLVMQQMLNDAHATSNTLIQSLMGQNAEMRATLAAIRTGVEKLFDGPYQPSAAAVLSALWPSAGFVNLFREDGAQ
jgi:hypothetical protein